MKIERIAAILRQTPEAGRFDAIRRLPLAYGWTVSDTRPSAAGSSGF